MTAVARNSAASSAPDCTTFVAFASNPVYHVSLISMIPSLVISPVCLCNNCHSCSTTNGQRKLVLLLVCSLLIPTPASFCSPVFYPSLLSVSERLHFLDCHVKLMVFI